MFVNNFDNVDRFSKIFHQLMRKKILYVGLHITKISTSPATCCYTTSWKLKIQKLLLILAASLKDRWHVPEDILRNI